MGFLANLRISANFLNIQYIYSNSGSLKAYFGLRQINRIFRMKKPRVDSEIIDVAYFRSENEPISILSSNPFCSH